MAHKNKTWIELDAAALRNNISLIKTAAPKALIAPALKSNAYGHGFGEILSIVKHDPDIKHISLDSIYEAKIARDNGWQHGIIILGYTPHDVLENVLIYSADQVIYDLETAQILNTIAQEKNTKARVHIKIETGTMRQGVDLADLSFFLEKLKTLNYLEVVGVSTHFAISEDLTDPMTHEQHERFKKALALIHQQNYFPTLIHSACSAALFSLPDTHHSLVRPGIALYGFYSSNQLHSKMLQAETPGVLAPVLTWKTLVVQIKRVPANAPIGYSHTKTLSRDSTIAVLPIGYADGLDRSLSSKGFVLIHGKRANILGRICMNICMVDITDIPDVKLEDEVVLIGKQGQDEINADMLAEMAQTIHWEIVARLNSNIPRIIVNG